MSTEQYQLSLDFPNGLSNFHLFETISDDLIITPQCLDVRTDNDDVFIDFDSVLENNEKTELDLLITNYVYVSPEQQRINESFLNVEISALTFQPTVTTDLLNWKLTAGELKGFDYDKGIFTIPENSNYTFGLSFLFVKPINIKMVTRLFDPSLSHTWLISSDNIDSINNESGVIIGLSNYLNKGLNFKLQSLFTLLETDVKIKLRIIKI